MWSRLVDGRPLHFRLGGLNHQNFLMIDEETGSWWQQISGECILGPLKGKRLERIASDEVTLATWRVEHPRSQVVRLDPRFRERYAKPDWEKEIAQVPVAGWREAASPLQPRDLIAGIVVNGKAVAYPLQVVRQSGLVPHIAGGEPVLVAMVDARGVRAFRRRVDGRVLEFYRKAGGQELLDAETGSTWNLQGVAVDGPLKGKRLDRIQTITEYWFDWLRYHPETSVYRAGR